MVGSIWALLTMTSGVEIKWYFRVPRLPSILQQHLRLRTNAVNASSRPIQIRAYWLRLFFHRLLLNIVALLDSLLDVWNFLRLNQISLGCSLGHWLDLELVLKTADAYFSRHKRRVVFILSKVNTLDRYEVLDIVLYLLLLLWILFLRWNYSFVLRRSIKLITASHTHLVTRIS